MKELIRFTFRMEMELMKIPGLLFFSEFVGTAFLIGVGLSIIIIDFSPDSPVVALLPSAGLRRFLTGFLFGTTGGLIALSPVGKISGAHINPVVTTAFWLRKKIGAGHALGYIVAQLTGGIVGAVPLLLWGGTGEAVYYGATLPGGQYISWEATLGEIATTFALIALLFLFLGHKPIRKFTPLLFPFLYAVMVYLEAPLSGTSTNPARSLGPEVVSWEFRAWWIYWVGPTLGAVLGLGIHKVTPLKHLNLKSPNSTTSNMIPTKSSEQEWKSRSTIKVKIPIVITRLCSKPEWHVSIGEFRISKSGTIRPTREE